MIYVDSITAEYKNKLIIVFTKFIQSISKIEYETLKS